MLKRILKPINSLSIRYRFFVSFLIVIIIPFVLYIAINIFTSARDSKEQALSSAKKILLQTKSTLDLKAQYAKNVMDIFALNDTVQELVNTDTSYYEANIGNWIHDRDSFVKLIYSKNGYPDITNLQLYMQQGLGGYAESNEFLNLEKVKNEHWYVQLMENKLMYWWFSGRNDSQLGSSDNIYFMSIIPSNQNIHTAIGIIKATIPEKVFKDVLNQAVFTEESAVFLVNSDNELIAAADGKAGIPTATSSNELEYDSLQPGLWKNIKDGGEELLLGVESIQKTDWKLVLLIPYKDILAMNTKARKEMFLILLIVLPLTLPLSFLMAGSSTKRIRNLISHMRKVVHGDFDVSILPGSNDEIGELTQNFNYMLTRIAILIDSQYQLGKEIKSLELKALQAQINPHFLYNTLDLINWMSIKYNAPKISDVVEGLSLFYKLSLNKGEDIVTLKNELEHIEAYVRIQNLRFQDGIKLIIQVPEALYEYMILKVTLQPLIENSINHGILEKDEETGTIRVEGALQDSNLILRVIDDGVGIPEHKIASLLLGDTSKDSHGFGVRNIHNRFKLNYGSEYGLTYFSQSGMGTTVELKLPAVRQSEKNS